MSEALMSSSSIRPKPLSSSFHSSYEVEVGGQTSVKQANRSAYPSCAIWGSLCPPERKQKCKIKPSCRMRRTDEGVGVRPQLVLHALAQGKAGLGQAAPLAPATERASQAQVESE
eukprot:scaffold123823_cov21-Tisochrysis_lutea.AAC.1